VKVPAPKYRCPLGSLQLNQRLDPEEVKKKGWKEQQILVISPEDERLDWYEQQLLRNIGDRLYGEEGGQRGKAN